jgi:hypothetical protein
MVAILRLCALPAFVALAYANGELDDRLIRETLCIKQAPTHSVHQPQNQTSTLGHTSPGCLKALSPLYGTLIVRKSGRMGFSVS